MLLLLLLVAGVTNTLAQNVTVHPGNGSMLPAKKIVGDNNNGDVFFRWRGFATWKHEQLSLTMTTGDSDNNLTDASNQLTGNGQLQNPANNIFATPSNTTGAARYLQIGKGGVNYGLDTYLTVVLPLGYRFTGYSITFHRINYPTADGISYQTRNNYNQRGSFIRWRNNNNQYEYSDLNETTADISFGETDNTFAYLSEDNASGTYYGGIPQNNTDEHTISRTSAEIGNVLYFKLSNNRELGRAFIMLDHMELFFTAEHNTVTTVPSQVATDVSAVDIPFTTGKVDYDELTNRTDGGVTRISYNGTIRDMNANLTLYEEGSTKKVTSAENDFDGTEGYIVDTHTGSISMAGEYFKLESNKHVNLNENGEAIYYIESPTWAINSAAANAHKNPIGYRIVSAKFNYAAGTSDTYFPATFKIQYYSTGHGTNQDGTYGLNTYSGTYNWNPSYHTVWRIDQEGYIYGYNTATGELLYLSVNANGNIDMTTTKPSATIGTFDVVDNDGVSQIRLKSDRTKYIGWREVVKEGVDPNSDGAIIRYSEVAADEDHRSTYNQVSAAYTAAHGAYTFKIYGPDGTTAVRTINVSDKDGDVEVTGYNNDAIKIGIIGTGLINGEITMQALDPYIDRLRIVCQQADGNGGTVSQQFNATDFSVKGGAFNFYVPTSFSGDVKFTFKDLYSKYGDNTYYGANNSTYHARYFFVGSEYDNYTDNNDNAYNRYNYHSGALYTTKIDCLQPGNKKYTFNNAATASTTNHSYFEEYPFTKALYASKVSGSFTDFTMPSASSTAKTAYLFTCDETRYNIAPTTATQHVSYAFYQMDIKTNKQNYTPKLTWNQVYDHTCYNNGTSTAVIDKPQYGLKLGTTQASDEGDPNGYLTVSQIKNAITTTVGIVSNIGKELTDANRAFDLNGDNKIDKYDLDEASLNENGVEGILPPAESDQILYIDGSELLSIVEDQQTLESLQQSLGANSLVYLPKGTTSEASNIAYEMHDGSFWGADNFELIDMRPFYAPYDIQIDPAKTVTYKRSITVPKNGKVTSASIIMPFDIKLENAPFTLHQMQESKCLTGTSDEVYFPDLSSSVSTAEANTPYLLQVTNPGTDDNYSFVLTQADTKIKATTSMVQSGDDKYTFQGETGNGAKDGKAIQFVNHGSYAGKQLAYDGYYFYFSKNMFLRSNDYIYKGTIKIAPFRTYYSATGEGRAKLASFGLIFDEGIGDDPTGISSLDNKPDLMVVPGNGAITMTSTIEQYVRVNSVSGVLVNNAKLQAGETQTINVPAGVYVINGVKIIVK